MREVALGGLTVSAQGLGCMGMSEWYGQTDWDESIATIHRALDLGVTFLDTADIYGAGHNEVLVGRGLVGRRQAAAVVADLEVEQFQALLLLEQGLADPFAVPPQQVHPLGLARSGSHELGVVEHVPHRHAGGPQLAQQQQPVQVGVAETPPPVGGALDAVEQADPLVPAQRVLGHPALLGGLPGGPARHVFDPRR